MMQWPSESGKQSVQRVAQYCRRVGWALLHTFGGGAWPPKYLAVEVSPLIELDERTINPITHPSHTFKRVKLALSKHRDMLLKQHLQSDTEAPQTHPQIR